jgi:hypothetical protein
MLRILGLSGKRGAGKDTMYQYIQQFAPVMFKSWEVKRYGLADRIKELVIHGFDVPRHLAYGSDADKEQPLPHVPGKTIRQSLQEVGVAFCKLEQLHWVRHLVRDIRSDEVIYSRPLFAVITDIRFDYEVKQFQHLGGRVVRLTRCSRTDSHVSETALDGRNDLFDAIIDNREQNEETTFMRLAVRMKEWGWIDG